MPPVPPPAAPVPPPVPPPDFLVEPCLPDFLVEVPPVAPLDFFVEVSCAAEPELVVEVSWLAVHATMKAAAANATIVVWRIFFILGI